MPVLLYVALLLVPVATFAQGVVSYQSDAVYEAMPVMEPSFAQYITGELTGEPHAVEFTTSMPFVLSFEVFTLPDSPPAQLNVIAVEVLTPRGVREVTRLKVDGATWQPVTEPLSKLTLLHGGSFWQEMASGTYRIEISTPTNEGTYLLRLGDTVFRESYGDMWQTITALYEFAGVSKFGMIRTSVVYYPAMVIIVLLGFGYTIWRTRERVPFLRRYG